MLRAARVAAERGVRLSRAALDQLADEVDPLVWAAPGRMVRSTSWSRSSARATAPSTCSRHSTNAACSCACCPNGRRRAAARSATPITASPSIGTCWEAAANAAALADRVDRPDLLVLAALFHDLGKGYPGDHTDAGVELMATIGPRLGLSPDDVATVVRVIRRHLLLAETAVRRDLADPATIRLVADAVGDVSTLDLLPRADGGRFVGDRTRRRGAGGRRSWSPTSSLAPAWG